MVTIDQLTTVLTDNHFTFKDKRPLKRQFHLNRSTYGIYYDNGTVHLTKAGSYLYSKYISDINELYPFIEFFFYSDAYKKEIIKSNLKDFPKVIQY